MKKLTRNWMNVTAAVIFAALLALMLGLGTPTGARADEVDAKRILKAMSEYMAAQTSISFEFDATLEVVTKEDQKLALASSAPSRSATRQDPGHPRRRICGYGDVL